MPQVLLVNPRSRRRRKARKARARRNPIAAFRRRRARRNPIGFSGNPRRRRRSRLRRNPSGLVGDLKSQVMPTLIGAGGALAADVALGFLPLPEALKSDAMKPFVRAGVAVGVGVLVGMFVNRSVGHKVMAGGLTVVAYDTLKTFLKTNVPALPLGCAEDFPLVDYRPTEEGFPNDTSDGMGLPFVSSDLGAPYYDPLLA